MALPPLMGPQVKHIMEVNVRQQRADNAPLRGPFLRLFDPPVDKHAGFQPLPDMPDNALVPNAMLEKPNQPLVVDGVEERADIRIQWAQRRMRGKAASLTLAPHPSLSLRSGSTFSRGEKGPNPRLARYATIIACSNPLRTQPQRQSSRPL